MCSLIQLPGFAGIVVGVLVVPALWWIVWATLPPGLFAMDVQDRIDSFLPILQMYIDMAKTVIGLASASIALLVGSATFRSTGGAGPLLATFASPLFLLALSIIWGVCFMPSIELDYEAYRHCKAKYTRFKYAKNQALGFSCLICFALGYAWLIVIVTGQH
jgi:hypothetical protein